MKNLVILSLFSISLSTQSFAVGGAIIKAHNHKHKNNADAVKKDKVEIVSLTPAQIEKEMDKVVGQFEVSSLVLGKKEQIQGVVDVNGKKPEKMIIKISETGMVMFESYQGGVLITSRKVGNVKAVLDENKTKVLHYTIEFTPEENRKFQNTVLTVNDSGKLVLNTIIEHIKKEDDPAEIPPIKMTYNAQKVKAKKEE